MALIECPECKASVSSKAFSCPNCGRPLKKQNTGTGCGCIIAIVLILLAIVALGSCMNMCAFIIPF